LSHLPDRGATIDSSAYAAAVIRDAHLAMPKGG
jgi:hypothetical protein